MKVSIIIPVYNVEHYIAACLQSVMDQTYEGALECILIDDCGKDRSIEIAQSLIDNYDGSIQFKILHHEHNRGLSAARNTGIKASTGEYLYFLDSDDKIEITCIKFFLDIVAKYPDAEMIQGGALVLGNINYAQAMSLKNKDIPEIINDSSLIKRLYLSNRLVTTAWNKMIKKDFVLSNNLFFEEGIIHEDILWTYCVIKKLHNIGVTANDVYIYNTSITDSITNNSSIVKEEKSWSVIISKLIKSICEPERSAEEWRVLDLIVRCINCGYINSKDRKNIIFEYVQNARCLKSIIAILWFYSNRLIRGYFHKYIIYKCRNL